MDIKSVNIDSYRHDYISWFSVSEESFLHRSNDLSSRFVASSIVGRRWFTKLHVLLLDCDGTNEMLGAASMLKSINVNYALVQSSKSRYWVIVDMVGSFRELLAFAKSIPGVDEKFINLSAGNHHFSLRLTPANGRMALFSDDYELKNPLANKWYQEFRALWNKPQIARRYQAEILQAKITDKTMIIEAANPTFQL